jgi:RNA polymerase sigma-70 factor (TIGR02957 family)
MSAATDLDDAATEFTAVRRQLFGIAYRMLGSVAEAEDVVQDAWIRWQGTDRSEVAKPQAFLTTMVTRMAINVLQSARARRETYPGPWLPEPVDTSQDPTLGAEQAEALELAVLVLLERLTPTERAAYVLREAFGYGYGEIADVVQVSQVAARQLVSRARKHLASEKRNQVGRAEQRRLLDAFIAAARAGDVEQLERLLAEDAVSTSDGGGVVRNVSRIPVAGRSTVAKFVRAFATRFWSGVVQRPIEVNGDAAVALERAGSTFAVVTVTASEHGIDQILWVMNPAKLEALLRGGPALPPLAPSHRA